MTALRRLALAATCSASLAAVSAQQTQPLVLSQLTWFDRAGTSVGKVGPLGDHGNIELSPNGSQVAVAVADRQHSGTRNIWMYPTAGGARVQFTSDAADEN